MRLGVIGGTFDPIHLGHLVLAESAREELGLERILFVPAGDPWRKQGRFVAPSEHRLAMVRLALEGIPEYEVCTLEAERPGPSYTADTLETIAGENVGADLYLLLGQDALADLPNWRHPDRIVRSATLAVARRSSPPPWQAAAEVLERRLPGVLARIHWLDMPAIDITATTIRERVRAGRSIRYLVPATVKEYILRHRLYAGG